MNIILLFFVTLTLSFSVTAEEKNLLVNGGFEIGTQISDNSGTWGRNDSSNVTDGWLGDFVLVSWMSDTPWHVSSQALNGHGDFLVAIQRGTDRSDCISNRFEVSSNGRYKISFSCAPRPDTNYSADHAVIMYIDGVERSRTEIYKNDLSFKDVSVFVVLSPGFHWIGFENSKVSANDYSTILDNVSITIETRLENLGTSESPYLISDAETLIRFRDWVNDGSLLTSNVFVRQTADIDMFAEGSWEGIGRPTYRDSYTGNLFEGIYDGGNHKISNLNLYASKAGNTCYGGFFCSAKGASILNLRIENVFSSNEDFFGGAVVGHFIGGMISNVTASGALEGSHNVAGFVCRGANGKISFVSCTNKVNVKTSYTKAGGFMSYTMDATQLYFTNCLNVGAVTVEQNVSNQEAAGAGYVGYSCAPVLMYDCKNTGKIHVSVHSNVVNTVAYNSVIAAGAVAWINSWRRANVSIIICGFENTGSVIAENLEDVRYAIASGVLGSPNAYYGYFRCPFVLDGLSVVTDDIHAYGTNAVSVAFFGGNSRYSPKTGYGTQLLYGRAPTTIQPFGNWDFEVGGYNATRKDGDYTVYYVRDTSAGDDSSEDNDNEEEQQLVQQEKSFAESWGAWSIEDDTAYVQPSSATDVSNLGRIAWRARDAMMRNGQFGCLPPSEKPIVLSVGTFSYNGILVGKNGEELEMDQECGVSVWHVRICEDSDMGVMRMMVAGIEVDPVSIPAYDHKAWTESVYGEPPAWLSAQETTAWYAKRSRSRVEMFATLVPSDDYATYQENQEADEEAIASEDRDKILIREFLPSTSTNALHILNVRMPNAAAVTVLGSSDLSGTNWTVNGVGALPAGRSANGVSSSSKAFFAKVIADTSAASATTSGDSDGDGISDVLEEYVYHTNPNNAFTSGDGLTDGEKIFRYELTAKSVDSDGDGFDDEEEIAAGQDPKVATPGASTTIRYTYDDDDRLTGTYFGNNGRSTTKLSPAGNPLVVEKRGAK